MRDRLHAQPSSGLTSTGATPVWDPLCDRNFGRLGLGYISRPIFTREILLNAKYTFATFFKIHNICTFCTAPNSQFAEISTVLQFFGELVSPDFAESAEFQK